MTSDDEDRESSQRDSSLSDESETDIATVLTQLIRRFVIHFTIFVEQCEKFCKRNYFIFGFAVEELTFFPNAIQYLKKETNHFTISLLMQDLQVLTSSLIFLN